MADVEIVEQSAQLAKAIDFVEHERLDLAEPIFSALYEADPANPVAESFMGLMTALQRKQLMQGLDMCKAALQKDSEEPLCYLNLAKVHIALEDRYHAIKALNRGLKSRSRNRGYVAAYYKKIGVRRKARIPFLDRKNPINRFLGKLTFRGGGARVR
ncbi:MAG: hypothetical protein P8Z49_01285 [Acidobacteriota bacterium]|jgi:predicted Zn-dependent protease